MGTPHIPSTFASTAQAAPAAKVAPVTPGGRQIAVVAPGLRGGAADASAPAPLPAPVAKASALARPLAADRGSARAARAALLRPAGARPAAGRDRPPAVRGRRSRRAPTRWSRRIRGRTGSRAGRVRSTVPASRSRCPRTRPRSSAPRGEPSLAPDGTLAFTPAADAQRHCARHGQRGRGRRRAQLAGLVRHHRHACQRPTGLRRRSRSDGARGRRAAERGRLGAGDLAGPGRRVGTGHLAQRDDDEPVALHGRRAARRCGGRHADVHAGSRRRRSSRLSPWRRRRRRNGAGGVDRSAPQTFLIAVTPVNDAPSLHAGADQAVLEDSGAQTVAGWATRDQRGPGQRGEPGVTFAVSSDRAGAVRSGRTAGGRRRRHADVHAGAERVTAAPLSRSAPRTTGEPRTAASTRVRRRPSRSP